MQKVYFYHEDKEAAKRNSAGLMLVRDERASFEVLYECREYSIFFEDVVDGIPWREIILKKPRTVPLTLADICRLGLIDLVDGVIKADQGIVTHIRIKP